MIYNDKTKIDFILHSAGKNSSTICTCLNWTYLGKFYVVFENSSNWAAAETCQKGEILKKKVINIFWMDRYLVNWIQGILNRYLKVIIYNNLW
jgi:hypothetical protein